MNVKEANIFRKSNKPSAWPSGGGGYAVKAVRISVCSRVCSTRANGVSLPLAREARNASALPSPEASTHTSRAAAKAG